MPLTLAVVASFLLACGEKEQPEPDSPPTPVIDEDNDGFPAEVDCNDSDAAINPDAEELCDGIDNNCNDEIDEGVLSEWFADADGDSFGDPESSVLECEAPADHVADSSDCDDSDPAVNPDGEEICDELDNDCNGETDENTDSRAPMWFLDADSDGHGTADETTYACERPTGYSDSSEDCDDTDATVHPDAAELCDGLDNNCDDALPEDELDNDGDGLVECTWDSNGWDGDATVTGDGDLDDSDPDIGSVLEDCGNGQDDDGDGATDCEDSNCLFDPGCPETLCEDGVDNDSDGDTDCDDADCDGQQVTDFNGVLGSCESQVELSCEDGFDNDLDGDVDCFDADCSADLACAQVETSCADGSDDDGDGDIDCADSDCAQSPLCLPESACSNGTDDDGDGSADCLDSDCNGIDGCEFGTELSCADGLDNDGDGSSDCADSSCANAVNCIPESDCADGTDNDLDGLADCLDSDCDSIGSCEFGSELSCGDSIDNDGDGSSDCSDSDCAFVATCIPEISCADNSDNDLDGLTDCLDDDCDGISGCEFGAELSCGDGLDNDANGSSDCDDSSCASDPLCLPETSCSNGADEDGDGLTDCLDSDCNGIAGCEFGSELTCDDNLDNDGDGSIDCLDSSCNGIAGCEFGSELTCDDNLDNDGDGSIDCLDSGCNGVDSCEFGTELSCGDGIDNDGDNDIDCDDSSCANDPSCATPLSYASDVQSIMQQYNCTGCHNGQMGTYGQLMNAEAGDYRANQSFVGLPWIDPGNPSGSYLYLKINSSPPAGNQMPPGPNSLNASQIATVNQWILDGANP